MAFNHVGCPIRTSPDHVLFADPRSFSQLTTSFFATGSLGILRSLLFSFSLVNHDRCVTATVIYSRLPVKLQSLFNAINENSVVAFKKN